MQKKAWIIRAGFSLLAAVASTATLIMAYHPGVVGCPGSAITHVIDCQAVVTSPAGHIFGLPLGFWGLVWLALYWIEQIVMRGRLSGILAAAAFLVIAYAVGTELRIGHLCIWCSFDQASILCLAIWGLVRQSHKTAH